MTTDHDYRSIEALNQAIDSCTFCRANPIFDNSGLKHILGAGSTKSPLVMFVLMNPTAKNPTLAEGYDGLRVSYAGVSSLWRVLTKAGFLPQSMLDVFKSRPWDDSKSQILIKYLKDESIYLTELVKCPSRQAHTPDNQTVSHNLKFMRQEIRLVNPDSIITFGLLPFQALTGLKIKLGDYCAGLMRGENRHFQLHEEIGSFRHRVFPCYFPTGRGNYTRAVEMLRVLYKLTNSSTNSSIAAQEGNWPSLI